MKISSQKTSFYQDLVVGHSSTQTTTSGNEVGTSQRTRVSITYTTTRWEQTPGTLFTPASNPATSRVLLWWSRIPTTIHIFSVLWSSGETLLLLLCRVRGVFMICCWWGLCLLVFVGLLLCVCFHMWCIDLTISRLELRKENYTAALQFWYFYAQNSFHHNRVLLDWNKIGSYSLKKYSFSITM